MDPNFWHSLSTKQKKQFKRRTITAMKSGADQNSATAAAAQTMGYVPEPTTPQPAVEVPAVQVPKPIAPPVIKEKVQKALQTQVGRGVRMSRKRKAKTRLSSLRIKRDDNKGLSKSSLSIGSGGTGLNVGGY